MTDDWNAPAPREASGDFGSLRVALLFGCGAIALALLVTPLVERQSRLAYTDSASNVDRMSTGSISRSDRYTIRRSVLQADPHSVCIIRANGSRSGDC